MQRDETLLQDMLLIRHYRGVDLREIFRAADAEIPRLIEFLRLQLPNEDKGKQGPSLGTQPDGS